ncbi:TonB-dependent receptor domain-containing protein [Sphingomonas sp. CFBP 13720]|uniref:TonB-dependent receptor domain-containing protein n=1 Tax=Sphingomonas sp. CFBP 13720 TaxID=2775302 RepID=UPI00178622E2|nr:TonB-dependent receptor [Sphingomonas sp. CFBP 13720]MBD8679679.1 TonB-dependent receptor [Sphingomonas sp. CFBP 13720]
MSRRHKTALILTTILAGPAILFTAPASAQTVPAQAGPPADADAPPPPAIDQSVPAAEPKPDVEQEAADETPSSVGGRNDETLNVTGTRLPTNDPTSDVRVYTADDIRALGVSNVQDFIRTLPQNQASVGTGLNNRAETEIRFDDGGLGGLGVGGVNLRGLGTKNTLVLVNGRRIAGAAGIEEGFANINNIPLAAIERVEISLGGGSSVYGSDALGGVVNFILKRGYNGYSVTARTELSSTGAHTAQWTGSAARSWGSGSFTGTVSYSRINPVENSKLGYTTHDFTGRYTAEELAAAGRTRYPLDQRSARDGAQPAALALVYNAPTGVGTSLGTYRESLQWRGGANYDNPSFADLGPFDSRTSPSVIPRDAGEYMSNLGFSASIDQRVTDRLRITIDYLGSINESKLREVRELLELGSVPLTQAYNPIALTDLRPGARNAVVSAYYYPTAEYESGRLQRGSQETTGRSHSVTGGVIYDFDKDTAFRANYTWSRTTVSGSERGLRNIAYFNPSTGRCGPSAGARNSYEIADIDAIAAAQCAAMRSSDPNLAFNFLSDGTATTGAPIDVFFVNQRQLNNSSSQRYGDVLFTAVPFALPAGKVRLAIGGEYRTSSIDSERIRKVTFFDAAGLPFTREALAPASTDVAAAYAELRLPLIDHDMGVPLIQSLDLSANARYDRYSSNGPVGTVDNIPFPEGGEVIEGKSTFDRVSPRIGLAWTPVTGLTLRGSWSSNFTPPPFSSLYNVSSGLTAETFLFQDPVSPDGDLFEFRNIPLQIEGNPQLRPETSQSYQANVTWTPVGVLGGLNVDASYYKTKIVDQIGTSADLMSFVSSELYFGNPEFFQRDGSGEIVSQTIRPLNIGRLETESVEVKVDYSIFTGIGTITPSLFYLRNLTQKRVPIEGGVAPDLIGTARGLDKYRVIGYLDFQGRQFSARLTGRYTPAYLNNYGVNYQTGEPTDSDFDGTPDGSFPVKAMTTFDLSMAWNYSKTVSINAGGRNIFDEAPPFALIDRRPFDASRYDIRGRVLYLEARLTF